MNFGHQAVGPQKIGLAGARSRASHVDARYRTSLTEDDGATRSGPGVGPVPDFDPGHSGDTEIRHWDPPGRRRPSSGGEERLPQ